jgi:hypothetical protein
MIADKTGLTAYVRSVAKESGKAVTEPHARVRADLPETKGGDERYAENSSVLVPRDRPRSTGRQIVPSDDVRYPWSMASLVIKYST